MKLSRPAALRIHFVLDQLLPPVLRDSRWFMSLPFRIAYGKQAGVFMDFKEKASSMTDEEFVRTYRTVGPVQMDRDIHVTPECQKEVLRLVEGNEVLDVGCGKGVLAGEMSASHRVTAVDIIIEPEVRLAHPNVRFLEANAERLPFEDRSFDTVVCTHTLEHVLDFPQAIRELRRVARQRIVVVVPKQRPYRFTFDLHLHFFPYAHSLLNAFRPNGSNAVCREIGGDLLYSEDIIA
jgi:ubiquinone/menaquinone biosynthesis C-methylase UbiE